MVCYNTVYCSFDERQNKKLEHEAPEETQRVSVKCVEKFTIQCLPCRSEDSAKDNTDEYTGHPNGKVENEDIPCGLREEVQALAKIKSNVLVNKRIYSAEKL